MGCVVTAVPDEPSCDRPMGCVVTAARAILVGSDRWGACLASSMWRTTRVVGTWPDQRQRPLSRRSRTGPANAAAMATAEIPRVSPVSGQVRAVARPVADGGGSRRRERGADRCRPSGRRRLTPALRSTRPRGGRHRWQPGDSVTGRSISSAIAAARASGLLRLVVHRPPGAVSLQPMPDVAALLEVVAQREVQERPAGRDKLHRRRQARPAPRPGRTRRDGDTARGT